MIWKRSPLVMIGELVDPETWFELDVYVRAALRNDIHWLRLRIAALGKPGGKKDHHCSQHKNHDATDELKPAALSLLQFSMRQSCDNDRQ
jgi:hypothetical protein